MFLASVNYFLFLLFRILVDMSCKNIKFKQRVVIEFLTLEEFTRSEIHARMTDVYQEQCPSYPIWRTTSVGCVTRMIMTSNQLHKSGWTIKANSFL